MIPIVWGIECQRTMIQSDIPCTIISSWKPSTGCIENLTIFSQGGERLQNISWTDSIPFCNATFNITTADTYIYNSTIEDGVIVVQLEDNMLSIILLQIFLIVFFVAIGLPHKPGFIKLLTWGFAVIELLVSVWIIYIDQIGGSINDLLRYNAITVLTVGGLLGFITLFMVMVKLMGVEKDKGLQEDSYVKWLHK